MQVDASCQSNQRYDIVFDKPGIPCAHWQEMSSGLLSATDRTAPYTSFKLDPLSSSPLHDYYVGRRFLVTGGPSQGSYGTVGDYLGRLDWKVDRGVTSVTIVNGGNGCLADGRLAGVGGGGNGFDAQFLVRSSIPDVLVVDGGVGCSGSRQIFTLSLTAGAVSAISVLGSGSAYITGPAIIICPPPCTGGGAAASCTASGGGSVTVVNVTNPGAGYSAAYPPTAVCPEGRLTATGTEGGSGFEGYYSTTTAGAIDRVHVVQAGRGYRGTLAVVAEVYTTCVGFELQALPSGYIDQVNVLNSGQGYSSDPYVTIGTHGGANTGKGCRNFDLRARVGDHTSNVLSSVTSSRVLGFGQGASMEDDFYVGMTFVTITGQAATITKYSGAKREATLSPPLTPTPAVGDPFGITQTPLHIVLNPLNNVNWVSQLAGQLAKGLECKCADAASLASLTNYTTMSALTATGTCTAGYKCSITLSSSAPSWDGMLAGETLYLFTGGRGIATKIVEYSGSLRRAFVSVATSETSASGNTIAFSQTIPANTKYLVSASHIATIKDGDRNKTLPGESYGIFQDDASDRVHMALGGRHFFCQQLVADDPPAPWINVPMRNTFAFRSVPRIASAATLTVAAEGRGFDDLLWQGNNITVTGEQGEFLGTLFDDAEMDKSQQDGGPITDTITLSPEKMLEMTSDRDLLLHFKTTDQSRNGQLRFRYMKLSFSPSAFYDARATTDIFTDEELPRPHGRDVSETSADTDPVLQPHNLTIDMPLSALPSGDGVFGLTVDGEMSEAFIQVLYGSGLAKEDNEFTMFHDWVWGKGSKSFGLSAPADVGVTCDASNTCRYNTEVEASASRSARHSAVQRIPRSYLQHIIKAAQTLGRLGPARATASLRFVLRVLKTPKAKLSPITLSYPVARCRVHSLSARDGGGMGHTQVRPSVVRLVFGVGGDQPGPPVGDATLWVSADFQHHTQHVYDPRGLPNQPARIIRTSTGEFYDTSLYTQRDPQADILSTHHTLAFLSSLAIHIGDKGELVDRLFVDDYRQYAPPFVDSITIPRRMLEQLAQNSQLDFTLDIPPGIGAVRIVSAVLAYPIE